MEVGYDRGIVTTDGQCSLLATHVSRSHLQSVVRACTCYYQSSAHQPRAHTKDLMKLTRAGGIGNQGYTIDVVSGWSVVTRSTAGTR